jgi:hypothetical protein
MPASRARKLSQLMSEGGSLDTQIDSSGTTSEIGGGGVTVYADMNALIAATGTDGAQAFVQSNNNIYVYSGSGWYKIATVQNDSPSAITGVDGTYTLEIDGTPTVITAVSTDPEGFPLTWSYSTSGLESIATISQADNVFTITPSTDDTNFGTFTLTINATDGVNGAVSANTSITLQFKILNSNYTTLLATAVDTSTNNIITDGSTNNHTVTVNGDAHAGTFSPYRHGGYSTYFDGSGDYYTIPNGLDLGTSDFTFEFWIWPDEDMTGVHKTFINTEYSGGGLGWSFTTATYAGYNGLAFGYGLYGSYTTGKYVDNYWPPRNEWTHLVVQRRNSTIEIYVNGVSQTLTTFNQNTTFSDSTNFTSSMNLRTFFSGVKAYVSDLRLVSGSFVYDGNFTPSTDNITAVTNTILLTNQQQFPYFVDNSSNAYAITTYGNTAIKPVGKYDHPSYDSATHGGSVYFDGSSGTNLTVANSTDLQLGTTSAFTAEFWVYVPATNAEFSVLLGKGYNTGTAEWYLELMADGAIDLFLSNNGTNYTYLTTTVTGVLQQNTWNHIALVRESTSTIKVYTNGTQSYSNTSVSDWNVDTGPVNIGGYNDGSTILFSNTYITDVRIVKGTAVYTSDFTPPTAPLTAITNTSLLVSGTDASIIDKSQTSNLQLVGNTTGSTTQVKFASTKSMYFDGWGDSLSITPGYDDPVYNFGTADWTIELWAYIHNLSSGRNLISFLRASTNEAVPHFYTSNTDLRYYVNNTDVIGAPSVLSLNTWHHIALTRNGNDHKIFVDGTHVGNTWTNSITYVQGRPVLGDYHSSLNNLTGATNTLHGYVQDLRITKGLARYTANFTPPTEPLKG